MKTTEIQFVVSIQKSKQHGTFLVMLGLVELGIVFKVPNDPRWADVAQHRDRWVWEGTLVKGADPGIAIEQGETGVSYDTQLQAAIALLARHADIGSMYQVAA